MAKYKLLRRRCERSQLEGRRGEKQATNEWEPVQESNPNANVHVYRNEDNGEWNRFGCKCDSGKGILAMVKTDKQREECHP